MLGTFESGIILIFVGIFFTLIGIFYRINAARVIKDVEMAGADLKERAETVSDDKTEVSHENSFEEKAEDLSDEITEEATDEIAELEQEKDYHENIKITATGSIIIGVLVLLVGISMFFERSPKYEFILEGNTVQIPCSYYDFEDLGFEMLSEYKMDDVNSGDTQWVTVRNSAGEEIELVLLNDTMSDKKTRGCTVVGISVDDGNSPDFRLTNDVKLGMSYDQVNDIMGAVISSHYGSYNYTEQVGSDTYKISIGYENPIISIDGSSTNNSYVDFDSLTYFTMANFWSRKVTSISVRLDS